MTTRAAKIARGVELLRRQGMADAAVILLARKFRPEVDLEGWADAIGLDVLEVQAAVVRYREANAPPRPPQATQTAARRPAGTPTPVEPGGPFSCPDHPAAGPWPTIRGLSTHRRTHGSPVPCPNPWCVKVCNPVGLGRHLAYCTDPAAGD